MNDLDSQRQVELDAALGELRARSAAQPSAALIARVLADADAQAGARPAIAPAIAATPADVRVRLEGGWRARLAARLSGLAAGWPAPAGLAAAAVAGLWLGVAPPPPVLALEEVLLGEIVYLDLEAPADVFDE